MTEKYDKNKGIALYINGKLVIGINPNISKGEKGYLNTSKGEAEHISKDGINVKMCWRNLNEK